MENILILLIEYKVVIKQSLEQREGERVFVVLVTTLRVSFALKKSVTSRPVGQLGKLPPIEEELSESSQDFVLILKKSSADDFYVSISKD